MPWCVGLGVGGWLTLATSLVVLVVAVWAVTRLFPPAPEPDALALLDARLAAGAVDVTTYRTLRAELAGRVPARSDGPR